MAKLIYGRNKQVKFDSEDELNEAIDYILNSSNVNYGIHEDNQNQGAWGSEDRIHFKTLDGVPDCLLKNMTAGNKGVAGRINCKEFVAVIKNNKQKR